MEMLVAMAVLAILLLALAQMVNVTGISIKNSSGHMTADDQARMIFDRLATDFAAMPKRYDIDFQFVSQIVNDNFYFYSEAPAFLASTAPSTLQNTASLIGYQINSSYQLVRLGYGLDWDQSGACVTHFTFPNAAITATSPSFAPAALSTINDGGAGQWSSVISTTGIGGNYHVLGDMVFRLEFCFQLKDGSYSTSPILFNAPSSWPTGSSAPKFSVTESGAPTPNSDSNNDDGKGAFATGSRWWDSTNHRGYICLQSTSGLTSTTGLAVWRPLGWGDVSGIVVAMALLDDGSRTILTAQGTSLAKAAGLFTDATTANLSASPPTLMATSWQTEVTSSSFATASGLPASVAAQVRIYQRCLYLDNSL